MYPKYREELLKSIGEIFKKFIISFLIIAILISLLLLIIPFSTLNDIEKIICIILNIIGITGYSYSLYAYLYKK